MTAHEILQELKSLGNEKTRRQNLKQGASENQFGVKLGDIRKVAKRIKHNPALALELWETENSDARMLAILLLKPQDLSADDLNSLVRTIHFSRVADWFNAYLVKKHPEKESLRLLWLNDSNPMAARGGWEGTYYRIPKEMEGLDLSALLDRIESEMGAAHPLVQWTMNFTLGAIGINSPEHRERAIVIGEKLGLYRDYPTAKGCTSPYVPIWVNEMVSRQG